MENKIYTEKTRKLRQNTQKIANFLRYYGKIHSKLPVFRVKSVKIYTSQKNLHEYICGVRDKYQVWQFLSISRVYEFAKLSTNQQVNMRLAIKASPSKLSTPSTSVTASL